MPRHLIGDAHEWINVVSIVPGGPGAKMQSGERTTGFLRGKKTLLSLTLARIGADL